MYLIVVHLLATLRELKAHLKKRVKNIVMFNVPESTEKEEEDRKKADRERIERVFQELELAEIKPVEVTRIGKPGGRFPQQTLVTLQSEGDCEKVMKKCKEGGALNDDIFITRDRTFNQRQEAKMARLEREKEENGGGGVEPSGGTGGEGEE